MIRIFAGFDPREAVGYHVFCQSVLDTCSQPVSITPLHLPMLGGYSDEHNDGTNAFGMSRFLVPYLCDYKGFALFVDGSDMLVRGDLAELWQQADPAYAVQLVQHDYTPRFKKKYIGTPMEAANADYPRKNWSSVMLINCAHEAWRFMTPEFLSKGVVSPHKLQRLVFILDQLIGHLGAEWNHLADEFDYAPRAKLVHFTLGIPAFAHYKDSDYAEEWREVAKRAML